MYEYYVLGTYGQSIWATNGDYDNTLGLQESTLDVTGGAPVGSLHQIQFDDSSKSPLAPSRAVNYSVNVLLVISFDPSPSTLFLDPSVAKYSAPPLPLVTALWKWLLLMAEAMA